MSFSDIQVGAWNVIGALSLIPSGGTHFYLDPANGSDSNDGTKATPFATIYKAFAQTTSGKNDVIHLVSDGTSASTARLSLALAQGITASATTGTLAWNKNAVHLVGECAASASRRARIAPVTTQTVTVFNSGNMVVVTGYGCCFVNVQAWGGFLTGGAAEICWTDYGRNFYYGCEIMGQVDTYSASHTDSRSLLCTGSVGDSVFMRCQIGADSFDRTAATNAVEFAAGTPRNRFFDCEFPIRATTVQTQIALYTSGGNSHDRFQLFERCKFLSAVGSGGSVVTSVAAMGAASGGLFIFKDCMLVGYTGYGDGATTRAQEYVVGPQGTSNSTLSMSGLGNTPVA